MQFVSVLKCIQVCKRTRRTALRIGNGGQCVLSNQILHKTAQDIREITGFDCAIWDMQGFCLVRTNETLTGYEIQIQDVKLFPQGYSALALHPECVRDEPSVLLADIGGWTVDLMRLDNSVPNAATCRSLELGVIRCVDEITEQVRRNTGLSVTDIQIERVLNGQSCSMDPAAKEIIVRHGRLYTEKILSAIMEAGFDLKAIPSVIIGGGASILKRHVTPQDGLCRQVYLTDVHANASGYERIVGQMCAK